MTVPADAPERGSGAVSGPPFSYAGLPRLERFADVLDGGRYVPVPDSWAIAHCDIVDSTGAIARGRYHAVNVAGVAAIAAVRNALGGAPFGFVFGGDGASLLVAPPDREAVAGALAATVTWVREDLGLDLRAALIPAAALRAAGADLRVARYAASEHVDYAMFTGGGLSLADAMTKAGAFALAPAPAGARPDLTGLSCRFEPVAPQDGIVLSAVVAPEPGAEPASLRAALDAVLALVEASPDMGRPLPPQGPSIRDPWSGLAVRAAAAGPLLGSRRLRRAVLLLASLVSYAVFRTGLPVAGFSSRRYRRHVAANADFRKYDDGLRLTVACPVATAEAIEHALEVARAAGLLRFGLSRQDAAVVTCITPSVMRGDHVHFVDGADGGYARAALQLKADRA